MSKRTVGAVALAFAWAASPVANAASDAELSEVREQLRQLKESYETRIQALEKRLQELEGARGRSEPATSAAPIAVVTQAPVIGRAASESAFNPAVSLVLAGTYGNLSQDPANYAITGFVPANNGLSPGTRGTSLRETELAIAANIDPYFRGTMLLSVDEANTVGIEEAFFQTIGLGSGLTLKGGRFLSALGYQNEIHSHAWDFADAPLVYRAFLNDGNYGDDGLQMKWLAPVDRFIELGAEIGRGRDRPGSDRGKNGVASGTLFAHLGDDIGDSHSYRIGISALRTSPQNARINDVDARGNDVVNSFSGTTRIAGVDFVYKYAPNGNTVESNFKLQGEYFRRRENGTLAFDVLGSVAPPGIPDDYSTSQSGWYLQGVYQFVPRWRIGARYDRLDAGSVNPGGASIGIVKTLSYDPVRSSVMVDYNPSEFSRIRLQYSRDRARQDATDNQVFIQYIYSLGAHGAHKF